MERKGSALSSKASYCQSIHSACNRHCGREPPHERRPCTTPTARQRDFSVDHPWNSSLLLLLLLPDTQTKIQRHSFVPFLSYREERENVPRRRRGHHPAFVAFDGGVQRARPASKNLSLSPRDSLWLHPLLLLNALASLPVCLLSLCRLSCAPLKEREERIKGGLHL